MKPPSTRLFAALAAFVALAVFSSSCSTAHKRAQEFLEKGLFSDAIATYEQILKRDPRDEDAVAGLKLARERFIDRRLIDVRLARMAGNPEQALDILKESVGKARDWGMPPGAKASFTQEEETELAFPFVRSRVTADLERKQPLRAEYFLRKYETVFSGRFASSYETLRKNVAQQGRETCVQYQKEKVEGYTYFLNFLSAYCRYWGEAWKLPESIVAANPVLRVNYLGALKLQGTIANLTPDQLAVLSEALQRSLESTAWFSPTSGTALEVALAGNYEFRHDRLPVPLSHVYHVQEPYTKYVEVKKERQVPYEEKVREPDYQRPGAWIERTVTRYRNEEYTTSEPRTDYKQVERTHHYRGFRHEQSLGLQLSGKSQLSGVPLELVLNESLQQSGIEHDERQDAIGLRPSRPQLAVPGDWLREQSQKLASDFGAKAAAAWKELYCRGGAAGSWVAEGDRVHLCLKQTMAEFPPFAENWYQSRIGLDVKSARELLGRF